jgi:hypothetical protein
VVENVDFHLFRVYWALLQSWHFRRKANDWHWFSGLQTRNWNVLLEPQQRPNKQRCDLSSDRPKPSDWPKPPAHDGWIWAKEQAMIWSIQYQLNYTYKLRLYASNF